MNAAPRPSYQRVFDAEHADEQTRLLGFALTFDQYTLSHLAALPLPELPRVLEIGPGAGTVAEWITSTHPPAELTLLDRDTTVLDRLRPLATRCVHTDISEHLDQPGEFDLIHARLVLMHLPDPQQVVRRLASWLRPGGWLVLGDALDASALVADPRLVALMHAARTLASKVIGSSFEWATTFPDPLRRAGLTDLGVAADVPAFTADSPLAATLSMTVHTMQSAAVADDLDTDVRDTNELIQAIDDPTLLVVSPVGLATAWGRRGL